KGGHQPARAGVCGVVESGRCAENWRAAMNRCSAVTDQGKAAAFIRVGVACVGGLKSVCRELSLGC
ncbi:MAG: hypothetical protein ACLP8B_14810, partial [Xanthobacteraceae bacterium]